MKRIHDLEVDDYLYDSTAIEPMAIQEEFIRIPMDLAYWNAQYADASGKYLRAKAALEKCESLLWMLHRERLLAAGPKAPTEAMVDAAVATDEELANARAALIDAEVEKIRIYGALDAVRSKRDMLISLGAHLRAELKGEPSIKFER